MNHPIKKLNAIEAARGFAALLVVLYHATIILALPKYLNFSALRGLFDFGHAGVDFFFVLSGFIIAHVHAGDIGVAGRCPIYAWRRFARIYPTYWVACALVLAAFAAGLGTMPSMGQVTRDLLLVPHGAQEPFIGVAWSLQHEVLFYFLFGIAIWRPLVGKSLLGIWFVGIVASAAGFLSRGSIIPFICHPNNLEFFFGIAATFVIARRGLPCPGFVALAGVFAFLGSGFLENTIDPLGGTYIITWRLAYGLSATAIVAGLAQYELSSRIRVPRALVFLGAASYAIYLTHQTIMSVICRAFMRLGFNSVASGTVCWVVLVLLSLILSILFYLVVDKQLARGMLRAMRRELPAGRLLDGQVQMSPTEASSSASQT